MNKNKKILNSFVSLLKEFDSSTGPEKMGGAKETVSGEEEGLVGKVYDFNPREKRVGKKKLQHQVPNKSIIDLFKKIMKGGFWLSGAKGTKEEIEAYQKFLGNIDYDVEITGKYDDLTKKATKELQEAANAVYEDYNDPSFKVDGIFGKGSLKMLIAGMRSSETKPTRESFEKNIFPNSTLDIEIIKWLVSQYNEIGSGTGKKTKKSSVKKEKKIKKVNVSTQEMIDANISESADENSIGSLDDIKIVKGGRLAEKNKNKNDILQKCFIDRGITNKYFLVGATAVIIKESGFRYKQEAGGYVNKKSGNISYGSACRMRSSRYILWPQLYNRSPRWKDGGKVILDDYSKWGSSDGKEELDEKGVDFFKRAFKNSKTFMNFVYGGELSYALREELLTLPRGKEALIAARTKARSLGNLAKETLEDGLTPNRHKSRKKLEPSKGAKPGDGYKYRGNGLIQTTGREGFRKKGVENFKGDMGLEFNVTSINSMMDRYLLNEVDIKTINKINNLAVCTYLFSQVPAGKSWQKTDGGKKGIEKIEEGFIKLEGKNAAEFLENPKTKKEEGSFMEENKKAFSEFLKLLKEQAIDPEFKPYEYSTKNDYESTGMFNMEKEQDDLVDGKIIYKIPGDKRFLYASDINKNIYYTIRRSKFKHKGGNKWIELKPRYKTAIKNIKSQGVVVSPDELKSSAEKSKNNVLSTAKSVARAAKSVMSGDVDKNWGRGQKSLKDLHPTAQAKFKPFFAELKRKGFKVKVNSSQRMPSYQQRLKRGDRATGGLAAEPCRSDHQFGFAIDMNVSYMRDGKKVTAYKKESKGPKSDWDPIVKIAKKHGIKWQGDSSKDSIPRKQDRVHFYTKVVSSADKNKAVKFFEKELGKKKNTWNVSKMQKMEKENPEELSKILGIPNYKSSVTESLKLNKILQDMLFGRLL